MQQGLKGGESISEQDRKQSLRASHALQGSNHGRESRKPESRKAIGFRGLGLRV